jgi:EpsI family protein
VGNWAGRNEKIDPEILDILGPGDFLARNYQQDSSDDAPVDLFVAYVPSQRIGNTLHSPKNCLPGTGWSELKSSRVAISLPSGETLVANRYLVSKGVERGIVFYWYWAHGRSNASEYWARAYLIEDSIRLNRSDGALIRFSTELKQHESEATAEQRLMSLLRDMVPVLEPYLQG